MMEFVSDSVRKVAGGRPDFTEHDRVKAELEGLVEAHGYRSVSDALMKILVPEVDGGGLEGALRSLLRRHDEGLVHSELTLLDPSKRSSWAPIRQRSWGPSESAAEIYRLRGQGRDDRLGGNVDTRA